MKTILDIITKAGLSGEKLVAFLNEVITKFPDLAPAAKDILAALQQTTDPATLAALAVDITTELGQAAQLHFDGKTHAGDGF